MLKTVLRPATTSTIAIFAPLHSLVNSRLKTSLFSDARHALRLQSVVRICKESIIDPSGSTSDHCSLSTAPFVVSRRALSAPIFPSKAVRLSVMMETGDTQYDRSMSQMLDFKADVFATDFLPEYSLDSARSKSSSGIDHPLQPVEPFRQVFQQPPPVQTYEELQSGSRRRTSRSFSGISDVRSGISSRLRRASTSLKSALRPMMGKVRSGQDDRPGHARKISHPEVPVTVRPSSSSIFKRPRPATSYMELPKLFESFDLNSAPPIDLREPPQFLRCPSRGAAARASAAKQNERLGFLTMEARRDPNYRGCRLMSDRESGISLVDGPCIRLDCGDCASQNDREGNNLLTLSNLHSKLTHTDPLSLLPAELVSLIFSFLDAASLTKVALVSKKWQDAAEDRHVWRDIFLNKFGLNTACMTLPLPVGGRGLGKSRTAEQDWKQMFKARLQIAKNWTKGNATAIYLNGHTDSVYCVQYDE